MSDPVLDAHKILPGLYRISGGPSPISIRDQMVRGWLVADRLLHNHFLARNDRLLVVGVGAGGVTAALRCASEQINTVLIDALNNPFWLQKNAPTRFLNPTQYDWPLDHWHQATFPWLASHARTPLPYPAGDSGVLAANWEVVFRKALSNRPAFLTFDGDTNVTLIDPDVSPPNLAVTFEGSRQDTQLFDAVIWAAGPGREECRLFRDGSPDPIHEGRAFWSRDPFTQPNCGLQGQARVLISGTGDGGLQDYLRIVAQHESAGVLYPKLNIPLDIAARIQSAEDRAHRARTWVDGDPTHRKVQEPPILSELHNAHRDAVEDSLKRNPVAQSLDRLFPTPPLHTLLIGREPYLTSYYALNRFLVLLVSTFLEQRHNIATLRTSTSISDLSTANTDGHACMVQVNNEWNPAGGYAAPLCHGADHEVTLNDDRGTGTTEVFNVIVVRHGSRRGSVPTPPLPAPYKAHLMPSRPRHLLPYHLPA